MSPKTKKFLIDTKARVLPITMVIILIMVSLTAVFLFNPDIENVKADVYPGNCIYHKKVTIDHDQIPADLTNFPVLVRLDDVEDMYDDVKNNLSDIEFWNKENTTQYYHEIEDYLVGGGVINATIWVNVTSVSSSADTVFYMYYDNATATGDNGYYPTYVWDKYYRCVYHFTDTNDSTINGYTLTPTGDPSGTTGKIGGAYAFDGNDCFEVSNPSHFASDINGSIIAWVSGSAEAENYGTIWNFADTSEGNSLMQLKSGRTGGVEYRTYMTNRESNSKNLDIRDFSGSVDLNYYHIGFSNNATNNSMFFNGEKIKVSEYNFGTQATDAWIDDVNDVDSFAIGAKNEGSYDEFWNENIDELRYSRIRRNDAYILASYNNIKNMSTFITFGAESEGEDLGASLDMINSDNSYFTTSGLVDGTYFANNTGPSYETAKLTIIPSGTYCEYIRINVSDIDTNITANYINITFDDDNTTWSGNWHSCTNGGEAIIVNGTNWVANNWMSGNNPFTADDDGDGYDEIQASTNIYWRVKVTYPSGIGEETYSKTDMTFDGGTYQ